MKLTKNILHIALIVFSVASLVLFFFPFATVNLGETSTNLTGAMMTFGQTGAGKLAISADVWLCFMLTAATVVFGALIFKFKGMRWASIVTSLASAIYMLVISLSAPAQFVDIRPLPVTDPAAISYTAMVLVTTIVLFVTAIIAIAYLFVSDYVEVKESNGSKILVAKRIINFFKDYKGEIKKIVWPGPRDVVKNTLIVFAVCLLVGGFVWIVDYGLSQLLTLLGGK